MLEVIGEPPLSGAVQLMRTLSLLKNVVGAIGVAGICADNIVTVLEIPL